MSFWATAIAAMWLAQEAVPAPGASMRQEVVGVELAPLSVNAGSAPYGGGPSRFQPGFGGTLRVARHKWTRVYWTPVLAGLFLARAGLPQDPGRSGWTILAHVQTEGGVLLPTRVGTFEFGLAAGAGILAIPYAAMCDGSCILGAKGPLLSPVVHYLLRERPNSTIGISLRAVFPVFEPHGEGFGYYTGRAALFLLALDLGLGATL